MYAFHLLVTHVYMLQYMVKSPEMHVVVYFEPQAMTESPDFRQASILLS